MSNGELACLLFEMLLIEYSCLTANSAICSSSPSDFTSSTVVKLPRAEAIQIISQGEEG